MITKRLISVEQTLDIFKYVIETRTNEDKMWKKRRDAALHVGNYEKMKK